MSPESQTFSVLETAREGDSSDQVVAVISKSFHSPFTGSTLLFGDTLAEGPIVVKFSAYSKGADHEWSALTRLRSIGKGVQQPLWKVQDKALGKGVVTRFVSEQNIETLPPEKYRIEAGQILRQVHSQPGVTPDKHWRTKQNFDEYAQIFENAKGSSVAELQPEATALPLLKSLQWPVVQRLESLEPSLCHQDLYDEQILLRGDDSVTMIDFENWATNDPLVDLSYYIFHAARLGYPAHFIQAILQGYQSESFDEKQRSSLAFYALAIAIRSVSYFHGKSPHYFAASMKALDRLVQSVNTEWIWKN